MNEITFHYYLILFGFASAAVVFVALFFVSAPYGRHTRRGWGAALPSSLAWFLMEAPAGVLFAVYFFTGAAPKNLPLVLFFLMYEAHYLHRGFIYPWMIRERRKQMPVSVALMGLAFNIGNTYTNGRYLFHLSGGYPESWLLDPRFLAGVVLFAAGFAVNRWADERLRGLRRPGETGYRIPRGGLFERVSCPNYLGEIIEWAGWALATWSLAGLAFAVWTFANLAPRAWANHRWYLRNFEDYPPNRKALIPWLW